MDNIKTRELRLSLADFRRLHHGLCCALIQAKADDIEATVGLMIRVQTTLDEIEKSTMGVLKLEWVDIEQPLDVPE